MTRRFALILSTIFMLLAAIACNLPSEISPQTFTQTAIVAASATAVSSLTAAANAQNAFATYTALAVTTDTPVPTTAPSATLAVPNSFPTLGGSDGAASTEDSGGPTATAPASSLKVGMVVKVNTTAGSQLNLRKTPNKDGEIVKTLPNGTKVTIIDGPQIVAGAIWWKVKVSVTNEVGWCLEFADNIHTLQP